MKKQEKKEVKKKPLADNSTMPYGKVHGKKKMKDVPVDYLVGLVVRLESVKKVSEESPLTRVLDYANDKYAEQIKEQKQAIETAKKSEEKKQADEVKKTEAKKEPATDDKPSD